MPSHKVELRKSADQNTERITGYGAVFYDERDAGTEYRLWSDIVERILPGAFDRALREDDVRAFFNHDPNYVLGRTSAGTLTLSIDKVGLRYEIEPSDSAAAQHVRSAVERGDVSGSSFMFEVGAATWIEERQADGKSLWIREITEIAPLYEVGPVCFPAYEATTAAVEGRCGPSSAEFRAWQQRHVDQARKSLQEFRDLRTFQRIGEARKRRERRLRVRV